ncbi:MAG TPA: S41 family peptidase [Candidatus Acidoferrales bacterium]|nr:S41 family peptidase [Candidatus Acidoferrales bacterium]
MGLQDRQRHGAAGVATLRDLVMRVAAALLAVFCALMPAAALPASAPNVASWLADFTQLQTELSSDYANLEWVAVERRIDLPRLVAVTEQQLRAASSDAEARAYIELFLSDFGDGHLEVDWPTTNEGGGGPARLPPLCARLGYAESKLSPGIAFDHGAPYQPLATPGSRYFPTGLLQFPNGDVVGVLRLPIFSADHYPELCEAARTAMGLSESSACDDACENDIELRAENSLTVALEQALAVLRTVEHLHGLIVDITRNGGGSDWLEPAARELTPRHLRSPGLGFVKSEHWTNVLNRRLQAIASALPSANAELRQQLADAQRVYGDALVASRDRCDRHGYFAGIAVTCSQIVKGTLYTSGTLPYAAPGSLPDNPARQYLFAPSRFTYREGTWNEPLIVLVDNDTASAAERFAAMLQDAGAATIVGVPTNGAGCGFTDGGIPNVLDHSGASVRMPDCVQYRADGTDAVAGITPDVLVPWRENDSAYQRVVRAFAALSAMDARRR